MVEVCITLYLLAELLYVFPLLFIRVAQVTRAGPDDGTNESTPACDGVTACLLMMPLTRVITIITAQVPSHWSGRNQWGSRINKDKETAKS